LADLVDDHLDKPSIRAVEALGRDTKFFVPLGTGRWFVKLGIPLRRIFELDWWESVSLAETEGGFVICDDCPAESSREKMPSQEEHTYFGSTGRPADRKSEASGRLSHSLRVQISDDNDLLEDNAATDIPEQKEASVFNNADIAGELEGELVTVTSEPRKLRTTNLRAPRAVFKITCTPAQHPTGRSFLFFDKNATKSATWVVEQSLSRGSPGDSHQREGARMFFGGDTGFRSYDGGPTARFVQGE
jgi:L-ascorbate metabolism protein UlaG (beta-lactamase superfamily)